MKSDSDILSALTERARTNAALRSSLREYFGRTKTASTSPLGPGAGLRLLNTLSRVPQSLRPTEEQQLYGELVALAFERPELRTDLLPLLTRNTHQE